MSSEYSWSIYQSYAHGTVRWRNFQNLSNNKNTWPIPVLLRLPIYPVDAARQGVDGEAKVEFTVTEAGMISAINIWAAHPMFESAVQQEVQLWRFEPGVDLVTRLPAETRMSLTVVFKVESE